VPPRKKNASGFATELTRSIRSLVADKSFDPEMLDILNRAFLGACSDLHVSDKATDTRERVAKRVIELADGRRDAEAIRAAVAASLRSQH